ncbi:TRI16 protein, partial [Polypterus senegalus]
MAEAQLFVSQDDITCLLCLNILTVPVTIPCGHSFCLECLTECWDQSQESSCPQCKEIFTTRPVLRKNTVLNEIITKSSPPSQNDDGPGDMECDFCNGKKVRVVKSCLTCMASFCEAQMQPHHEGAAWKGHKLFDLDENLQEKLCAKHQKILEIFCKTDDLCICMMCVVTGHKSHEMVELETEREEKQKQLEATQSEITRRIEEREKKLKESKKAMEQMKISVETELEENKKIFNDLILCIEEAQKKLAVTITEQEMRESEKTEGVMERLEKEIEELKKRDAELKELSDTKDHAHFLQTFTSCCVLPADGDSLSFTLTDDFSSEDLRKELLCLIKGVEKISQWDIMTLTSDFCSLTLDINTAHRRLRLSEGNKKVTCERTVTDYPDHPDRFDRYVQVLCREALTGTRCYWEVKCTGHCVVIGVAYKGLGRKGEGVESCLGDNDKSWCLLCSHSKYSVRHNDKWIVISAPYSPRVGVYLDWPAGSLSFYSVSHTMTLLHRFSTPFTDPIFPGFGLNYKSSITICPVTPGAH